MFRWRCRRRSQARTSWPCSRGRAPLRRAGARQTRTLLSGLEGQEDAAVAAICRRLGGLPLALELVAARTRALTPTELLALLDYPLTLLVGGSRDLPERQQTMRAAIAGSDELLDPAGQAAPSRLAVFSGGWTLQAAEAVCGEGFAHPGAVLDLLDVLVEQLLVVHRTVQVPSSRCSNRSCSTPGNGSRMG